MSAEAQQPETLVAKIVSGGQTGADLGGLDAAIACDVPHGGWCPKGRGYEEGVIPDRYNLVEMHTPDARRRTEQNVIDSDATLVFAGVSRQNKSGRMVRPRLSGGSKRTAQHAKDHGRPHLVVEDAARPEAEVAQEIIAWLESLGRRGVVLNVAGPRESKAPGIHDRVFAIVRVMLEFK